MFGPRTPTEVPVTFDHCVSVGHRVVTVSQSSFACVSSGALRRAGQRFCSCPVQWGLSGVFLEVRLGSSPRRIRARAAHLAGGGGVAPVPGLRGACQATPHVPLLGGCPWKRPALTGGRFCPSSWTVRCLQAVQYVSA